MLGYFTAGVSTAKEHGTGGGNSGCMDVAVSGVGFLQPQNRGSYDFYRVSFIGVGACWGQRSDNPSPFARLD